MKRPIEPAIGDKTKRMLTQFIFELRQNSREYIHTQDTEENREINTEKRIKELWENLKKKIESSEDSKKQNDENVHEK